MNLSSTISLLAGGLGSGCRGSNCGRKRVSFETRKYPGGFMVVAMNHKRKDIGFLMVSKDGKEAKVDGAQLNSEFRGQGHGKAMYEQAIDELKNKHRTVERFISSFRPSTSAEKVWESLSKVHSVSQDEHKRYVLKLK